MLLYLSIAYSGEFCKRGRNKCTMQNAQCTIEVIFRQRRKMYGCAAMFAHTSRRDRSPRRSEKRSSSQSNGKLHSAKRTVNLTREYGCTVPITLFQLKLDKVKKQKTSQFEFFSSKNVSYCCIILHKCEKIVNNLNFSPSTLAKSEI